ncbi:MULTISPECIES: hypothetical protein [unclassified Ruegeria]|uniref:hypothetical protein n=1 Tax=unclassified Ruegeria TaxID=2625375 RepID=UPI001488AA59|nr:hypothetical protein [Ruegeria sp. HKCCD8929]
MLSIYARAFMTATRQDATRISDAPKPGDANPRRGVRKQRWWPRWAGDVNLNNL